MWLGFATAGEKTIESFQKADPVASYRAGAKCVVAKHHSISRIRFGNVKPGHESCEIERDALSK